MAISEQDRLAMYDKLREVLGMDDATTMMGHLPPGGWDTGFARFEAVLDQRFAAVDTKFAEMGTKFAELEVRFERSLRDVQRNLFLGMLIAQTAFAGILFAAFRAFA